MDTSIPTLFNSCCDSLKTTCSRIERESTSDTDLLHLSRWQDELGRLRLWAANIGVHQTGQSSLEFRLKESSHIREQVMSFLLNLGQMLQEVEDVLDLLGNGHASQIEASISSDDDYDTGEELTQLHGNIVTVINCLFQMSMLVRNPARHDFYMLPQSQVLASRSFDQAHVREKYPEADQGLVERLGLAMTIRRQYLRHRKRDHAQLNQGLDIGTGGSAAPTVVLSDTISTGVEPWHIKSQDKAPASEKSQDSSAPSMRAGGALVIPSPPKESSGGAPFECPYCAVRISVDGTLAWHKHVFQDLQPYICTVAACSTPHTLFSKRHDWVQHLKEAHPREWTGDENIAGAAINEPDISSFCTNCPLCKSNSKSEKHFVRHLARHLQELVLFVLPQDDADSDLDDGPGLEFFGKSSSESSVSSTVLTNPEHGGSHDEQQVYNQSYTALWSRVMMKGRRTDPEACVGGGERDRLELKSLERELERLARERERQLGRLEHERQLGRLEDERRLGQLEHKRRLDRERERLLLEEEQERLDRERERLEEEQERLARELAWREEEQERVDRGRERRPERQLGRFRDSSLDPPDRGRAPYREPSGASR